MPNRLREHHARPAELRELGANLKDIVDPRCAFEGDRKVADCKDKAILGQWPMCYPNQAKEIRPPSLEEPKVARVVNGAREVGILKVDADREDVPAAVNTTC